MNLFYSWVWFPNEDILSPLYSRIGMWKVVSKSSEGERVPFKVILALTKATLVITPGNSVKTHSRAIRLGLLKKRNEAIARQELDQFNEGTRLRLEKTLLTWAESVILTPMQLLASSLPPKV